MISPTDMALLGVVPAAVVLLVLRRRRGGVTRAAASAAAPAASGEAGWAEAAATLAPVREPESATAPDDGWGEIITDPGWYLPGETDIGWQSPVAEPGPLVPGPSSSAPLLGEAIGGVDSEPEADGSWLESSLEPASAPAEVHVPGTVERPRTPAGRSRCWTRRRTSPPRCRRSGRLGRRWPAG